MWVKLAELEPAYTGRAVVVETDPTRERENERPWDEAKRRHWFWSEVWKVRREFWPVLLAALIVNLLAFAMPLFTMNVYDRVIPNKAVATLWVLALGVLLALVFDFTLRIARVAADRRGRPQARRQAVAEAVREGDEPADGRPAGQHRRARPARFRL